MRIFGQDEELRELIKYNYLHDFHANDTTAKHIQREALQEKKNAKSTSGKKRNLAQQRYWEPIHWTKEKLEKMLELYIENDLDATVVYEKLKEEGEEFEGVTEFDIRYQIMYIGNKLDSRPQVQEVEKQKQESPLARLNTILKEKEDEVIKEIEDIAPSFTLVFSFRHLQYFHLRAFCGFKYVRNPHDCSFGQSFRGLMKLKEVDRDLQQIINMPAFGNIGTGTGARADAICDWLRKNENIEKLRQYVPRSAEGEKEMRFYKLLVEVGQWIKENAVVSDEIIAKLKGNL
jgi:hypothetical protein